MDKFPLLSSEIVSLTTHHDESVMQAWSGHTWAKFTRAAVGGSDPTGTVGSDPAHAWRVQCTSCGMQMGKLKWGNLQRHHKSQTHRAAVLKTIGVKPDNLTAVPGAPRARHFAHMWKELRAGAARIATEDYVG